MLLQSIELQNFRQFINEKIDFSTDPERNVTLIIGENGTGKTTFAQAFFWCLYGETDFTNKTMLNMAIQSAIDGRLRRMEDYIARSSFTRNVEQDMTNGIIAEAFEMDREDLKRRRAQSVRNVKATNGLISLEKYARSRQEQDWDDDEWQD